MPNAMTSRERIRATLRREPTDRLPICFEGICHGVTRFIHEQYPDPRARTDFYLSLNTDVALPNSPETISPTGFQTRS